jgi:ATP adenylyltransferase
LHLHIVPRWSGDANFMPVVSDTKVMPQSLAAVRQALGVPLQTAVG